MEYISAIEASIKWGVSLRQVQRLLADGQIPRAKKYGRSWMIPADAEKPIDSRRRKKPPQESLSSDLSYLIASTTVPMTRNNPDVILDIVSEKRLRLQYEGELAYLRGDFCRAIDCFHSTKDDDAARLRACPLAIAAAISLGDYETYTEIDAYLKGFVKADEGSDVAAFAELALATAAVSVIAPNMAPPLAEGWGVRCPPGSGEAGCSLLAGKIFPVYKPIRNRAGRGANHTGPKRAGAGDHVS